MSTCTFKPKGMSYTEFLRSKKSTAVKVINTKKLQDASDITTARRLGASTVFALNNDATKGSVAGTIDFSQGPLHAVQSYYKEGGAGRRVGTASEFTAYTASQAIGGLVQAGLPPTRIVQVPVTIIQSPPVAQTASDFVRKDQGKKDVCGQYHTASTVTPPKFVDDTIRNTGSPECVTRPANHLVKAKTAFAHVPKRPSQAGGQYAIKGDLEPGKQAGVFGGVTIAHVKSNIPVKSIRTRSGVNVNYKVGAALDNIPYVENHHGNDLRVNPQRRFVKYKIPAGTSPHLKINKPINTI